MPHVDPYDQALTDEPSFFAGKVTVDAWTCVLKKGVGKVPYDEVTHKGQRTSVAIDITVEPLDPTRKLIERSMLNWTPPFKQVVRPSVEALADAIAEIRGLQVGQFNTLKELTDLYVIGEFVQRPDNKDGETWTTLRFDKVFATEDECRAVYEESKSEDVVQVDDVQRAQMAAFLPALWSQAGKDVEAFEKLLASNPMLSNLFDMHSAEVSAVISEEIPF